MGIEHSSVVPAPVGEVFAWHTRPGAFVRLLPPWQPLTIKQEASSLRDGEAVLGLPGGLRWVARHQREEYEASQQFVDVLVSRPMAALLSWRHIHRFSAVDENSTRVTDRIETPIPAALLRSTMRYRHRQLADDLASQSRLRPMAPDSLTVAVTGSSGLVGTALTAFLTTFGYRVIRLVRRRRQGAHEREWRPHDPHPELLHGVDAVVHLAGISLNSGTTPTRKAAVQDSRIGPTRRLAELAATTSPNPKSLICASATDFYGTEHGDDWLTETSDQGDDFRAEIVAEWEKSALVASRAGVRTVLVRTGQVQSPRAGMLRILFPLFFAGLGGRLTDSQRWLSWISLDDIVDIYARALFDTTLFGPINAVSPHPVNNDAYGKILANVLKRPAYLPTVALTEKLLRPATLTSAGQRVRPQRLLDAQHTFRFPHLEKAFRHTLGRW